MPTTRVKICVFVTVLIAVLVAMLDDSKIEVDSSSRLDGKTVVITGGTSGIGFEVAKLLTHRGASTIVTGRSKSRAEEAAKEISETSRGMQLSLTEKGSVEAFAKELKAYLNGKNLDVLVLNAGMFYGNDFTGPYRSEFGQDTLLSANHLGHFLLVHLLRPVIEASHTRVVFVSSISHWLGTAESVAPPTYTPVAPDGISLDVFDSFTIYGASKLQNVLFANKLRRELRGCAVVVCTPGFVATHIGNVDRSSKISMAENLPLAKRPVDGGMVLQAAVDVDPKVSNGKMLQPYWIWEGVPITSHVGRWFFYNIVQEVFNQRLTWGLRAHSTSAVSYDHQLQDHLWEWSKEVLSI